MTIIEDEEANQKVVKESGEPIMVETEKAIAKETDRRICPLSQVIVEMLVHQMGDELSNHNLYRSFASYFGVEGLPLLEKYYIGRAKEEYLHHEWIYGYLVANDARFLYPEIKAINIDIKDRVVPFTATVDREIQTTLGINAIVEQAMKEGDWATFKWLQGESATDGKLVLEQVEEESISRTIADMAQEDASWLRKQVSIYDFYEDGN